MLLMLSTSLLADNDKPICLTLCHNVNWLIWCLSSFDIPSKLLAAVALCSALLRFSFDNAAMLLSKVLTCSMMCCWLTVAWVIWLVASIAALSANKLVCSAIPSITFNTPDTSFDGKFAVTVNKQQLDIKWLDFSSAKTQIDALRHENGEETHQRKRYQRITVHSYGFVQFWNRTTRLHICLKRIVPWPKVIMIGGSDQMML